jgi:hypothetical protein
VLWLSFSFSSKVQHLHLYACLCPMLSTCPLYRPRWLDHGNVLQFSVLPSTPRLETWGNCVIIDRGCSL